MPTGRTCGRCENFIRLRQWGRGRNGLCEWDDCGTHSDSSIAKKCKGFIPKKYNRIKGL